MGGSKDYHLIIKTEKHGRDLQTQKVQKNAYFNSTVTNHANMFRIDPFFKYGGGGRNGGGGGG